MKLPTREQCLEFYLELNTPDNIIRHVLLVNKVAIFLARELRKKGVEVNINLVDRASLLHDLDKWLCINDKDINHGFETERILTRKGFPEVGFFARQHRADLVLEHLGTWEEKIINYADKRVQHDKITTMKKRQEYFRIRYPTKDPAKREKIESLARKLEQEIFSKLDFGQDELEQRMNSQK